MINTDILKAHFAKIGAALEVRHLSPANGRSRQARWSSPQATFFLNVEAQGRRDEQFILTIRGGSADTLEFMAPDVRPTQRHLLLLARRLPQNTKQKFLCGHDERHWFVAAVPDADHVATVAQALEALKPESAVTSQTRHGVRAKNWHKRHNAGFIRQGEWFFIPTPDFTPFNQGLIFRNEPLVRPGGTPHMVTEVYREGGETVYVSQQHPRPLTIKQYRRLLKRKPQARRWAWQTRQRNPQVYARGKVRHPDHKTIVLPFWHRVAMSGESRSAQVTFLD